jgi:hypothetical protein
MCVSVMRKAIVAIGVLAAFCSLSVPLAMAQDKPTNNMQILREKVTADKRLFIAANMDLTESEAKDFWPLYEAHQKDLEKLTGRSVLLMEEYAREYEAISDKSARKLLEDYVLIERDRQKFREYYLSKFRQVLPDKKVVRYYQLENKIQAVADYDLAARIPLIE